MATSQFELDLRVIRDAKQDYEQREEEPNLLDLTIRAEFVVDWQIEEAEAVSS